MSGPKVVRVVTKQELKSICKGRIDALRDAIEQWRKCASKHDALTFEMKNAQEKRLASILEMFEREQFREAQKQCAVEMTSLQAEMNRIREEAIAKAEQERNKRRKLKYSAETLIATFKAIQRQVPEQLLEIVSSALSSTDTQLATMNANLGRIVTEYISSSTDHKNISPLQKELAKKLEEGEKVETLVDWKVKHEDAKAVERDCRLDKLMAQMEATEQLSSVKPFLDRIDLISREASASQRSLLTDSLIMDLMAYVNERKVKDEALADMRGIRSELHRLTSKQAKDLEALINKAIASEDTSLGKLLHERGVALIKEEMKAMAGEFRRSAVLKGLSELGYEVREDMLTAWAEDGRLVVKKPYDKGYGVELGAVGDAERMQVQLVSVEDSPASSTASQDRDREIIWCSEFSRLQSLLEKAGTSLHIEKALPVGAKPLKKVQGSDGVAERSRSSKKPNLKEMHN